MTYYDNPLYRRIAIPNFALLLLQIFSRRNNNTCQFDHQSQNRMNISAPEGTLAAPVVANSGAETSPFPCVGWESCGKDDV